MVQGGHAHQISATDFETLRQAFHPAAYKVLRRISRDLCQRLRATNDRIVAQGSSRVQAPSLGKGRRPTEDELNAFGPFQGLPQVVKLALTQKLEVFDVDAVTPLFAEGEAPDGAWFLVRGEVSVGRNGKTLANLDPGTMFGIVSCIDAGRRSASCITAGPARLMRLGDKEFDQLFASGNRFAYQVVDLVARQLVAHVRSANRLIPLPGRPPPPAGHTGPPKGPTAAANLADDDVIIPLELELDVKALDEPLD